MIVAMDQIILHGSSSGIHAIEMGMPHRGRLNVLGNIMDKPIEVIFAQFDSGSTTSDSVEGSGDVKYHLGTHTSRRLPNGKTIELFLASNPSHLEAVSPVVVGKVRARQNYDADTERKAVLPLLIHGDAAFAGQGVVSETLELSALEDYTTGGTIHLVVNNQIGFTTSPTQGRSSPYSTDVAKSIQAPILHVNGDDPEAVATAARMAVDYRQQFGADVVVDIYGYRRHGHNEMDEPMYTQPRMYSVIKAHQPVHKLYAENLISSAALSPQQAAAMESTMNSMFSDAYSAAKAIEATDDPKQWYEAYWEGDIKSIDDSAVPRTELLRIGAALSAQPPPPFKLHRNMVKQLKERARMFETGQNINWGVAEALAFGSLLAQDVPVRLSGQDSIRGTFSHRHSAVFDQNTEEAYVHLNTLGSTALFDVCNSSLSELAVLGFELGFSMVNPRSLVLWEAQFGDFANGAQVIIDQFICAGEQKWRRQSGLTMLLPHGYEGQGPEHSSARLERFLQLCDEDPSYPTNAEAGLVTNMPDVLRAHNMIVANVSTPANYFHILRRQLVLPFRKPLVLMTPKALLKFKHAVSSLDDMAEGSQFLPVIPDPNPPANPRRLVFCSGKVYYDLMLARESAADPNVALIRVEQLHPFPFAQVAAEIAAAPDAEVMWAQEEPLNMGSWTHVSPRLRATLVATGADPTKPLGYAGRKAAASPATGRSSVHREQAAAIIETVFAS